MNTLIFDCDGVLSDTERYGHLPAFNQTFEEFRLPVRWSEADYGEKLRIGGGKERMASLLTESFVALAGLPRDAESQARLVARWHKRKTEIYRQHVLSGALPPRPGVRRLIEEALDAGWQLAVASTSAEESVAAVLEVAAGRQNALRFGAVLAGDIVHRKKPAPDIYELAVERLAADRLRTLVIEDSQNGLESCTLAGLACVITVNGYTRHENFERAALVLTHLGDPNQPLEVLANRSSARPDGQLRVRDLEACLPAHRMVGSRSSSIERGAWKMAEPIAAETNLGQLGSSPEMGATGLSAAGLAERIVRSIARTAIDNEAHFSELDSVVGDGDFGFSLARGFEKVLADVDSLDKSSPGPFLKKVGLIITSRCGGTSGPIWGTAFLRAGAAAGERQALAGADVVAMLRAAFAGIQQRGGAALGDKTLLDALGPFIDSLERDFAQDQAARGWLGALEGAAAAADAAARSTVELVARRGRASYTGERSRGSIDPGAAAVALITKNLCADLRGAH